MSDLYLLGFKKEGDNLKVLHGQETAPILEANFQDRQETERNWRHGEDMRHVARIPLIVWLRLEAQGITRDKDALKKWLKNQGQLYMVTEKRI